MDNRHQAPETKSSSVPALEDISSDQSIHSGSWKEYSLPTETATQLFKLLDKYHPETPQAKKERLMKRAEQRAQGKEDMSTKRPAVVSHEVTTVTSLVAHKKALLVVIADDVEPIRLVSHLPNLCIKNGVPYCIVKDEYKLGRFVAANICSCLALSTINSEDTNEFDELLESLKPSMAEFNKIAERSKMSSLHSFSHHRRSPTGRRSKSPKRDHQRSRREERVDTTAETAEVETENLVAVVKVAIEVTEKALIGVPVTIDTIEETNLEAEVIQGNALNKIKNS